MTYTSNQSCKSQHRNEWHGERRYCLLPTI